MKVFLLFAAALLSLALVLNLALSRWKFHWKGFLIVAGYALAAGLPVAYTVMFPGAIDTRLYAALASPIALPLLIQEAKNLARRRSSPLHSICGVIGILCLLYSPLLGPRLFLLLFIPGLAVMGVYLYPHARHPALNPMWLEALVREAASEAPLGCGYSSKPVTVLGENGVELYSGSFGLRLRVKKDRTILWIGKKLHEELGRPSLEALATEVAERLREEAGR